MSSLLAIRDSKFNTNLLILLIAIFPLMRIPVPNGQEEGAMLYSCWVVIIITGLFIIQGKSGSFLNIHFSKLDLAISAVAIYIFVRDCISISSLDLNSLIGCICCLSIYSIAKKINYKRYFVFETGLIMAGMVQSVICILQICKFLPSYHAIFLPTGSFDNPAFYGMFIACILPFILNRLMNTSSLSRKNRIFLFIAFIIMTATVIISASRASWICAIVSIIILIYKKYPSGNLIILKRNKIIFISSIFLLSVTVILLLYFIKPVSANSRLYIWNIASKCIFQHPIFGVGRNFSYIYMTEQADYLLQHPQSSFNMLADNIHYCYNGFLQFMIQYGIIGMILVIYIVKWILFTPIDKRQTIIKASLIGIIIASLFTYATFNILFLLLLSFYGGMISRSFKIKKVDIHLSNFTEVCFNKGWPMIRYMGYILFIMLSLFYSISSYYWIKGIQSVEYKCYEEANDFFNRCEPWFNSNGYFLNMYGRCLNNMGEYLTSNMVMNKAIRIRYSSFSEIIIGQNFTGLGDHNRAMESFYKAYAMVPSKMYPLYLIALLQYDIMDYDNFTKTAHVIFNMPIKVTSTANRQMIDHISILMNNVNTR